MTPEQLGHRAAAQGESVAACPFPVGAPARLDYRAWFEAFARVDRHRVAGRDPNGHAPISPHLCIRDSRKVCNCCGSCSVKCREEGQEGVLHTLKGIGRKALGKLVKRLEGVAPPIVKSEAKTCEPDVGEPGLRYRSPASVIPDGTEPRCINCFGVGEPCVANKCGPGATERPCAKCGKPATCLVCVEPGHHKTCRCGHAEYLHAAGSCRHGDKGPCGCIHFVPTPATLQDADTTVTADRKRIAAGLLAWFGNAPEWSEYSSDDFAQWILNGEAAPTAPK